MNAVNDLTDCIQKCFWSVNARLLHDQASQRRNEYDSASFRYQSAQDDVLNIPCETLLTGKILHLDAITSRFVCFVIVKHGTPRLYLTHPGLWQRIRYKCNYFHLVIHVDSKKTIMEMIPAEGRFVLRNSRKKLELDDDQKKILLNALKH